jgi:molybdate/tungstate transport system substrate-binding protein
MTTGTLKLLRRRFLRGVLAFAVIAVGAAACTSPSTARPASAPTTRGEAGAGSGPVDVLYAGSLVDLMQRQVEPAFHKATGYTVQGVPGGAQELANQIKGEVRVADVFVSASRSVDATLEGAANGDWLSWYVTFARSPLVLGYNPSSRFAADLRSEPWYDVVTKPGFLLGRSDPATDPKGRLAVQALESTASAEHLPALAALTRSTSGVYPEETLVGRLQAGQLDAGFFYASEAKAASIPTVPLRGVDLAATYTIAVVERAPHRAAAQAFVTYLLTAGGVFLERDGFEVLHPLQVSGRHVPGWVTRLAG